MLQRQLIALLIVLVSSQQITATGADNGGNFAARSEPSPGGACYFECPATYNGYALESLSTSNNPYSPYESRTTCYYNDYRYYCMYETDTGARSNTDTNCPAQLPIAQCASSNPDSNQYFKRSKMFAELSPAQRRIRALQFKPGKKKAKKALRYRSQKARKVAYLPNL